MLTEMVEYGCKIQEKVKAMKGEIKENIQGTNSEGEKTRTQINDMKQKEDVNNQQEQNEETRIQKNKERLLKPLGQLEMFQHLNHRGARRRRGRAKH